MSNPAQIDRSERAAESTDRSVPLLQAEEIHKSYRIGGHSIDVLRGVSLTVRHGESLAVVGVSGAGKSTLLHVLGGLDKPEQGTIRIEGRDFYDLSARRRAAIRNQRIGFVFQSYNLLPELDVLENVMLPAMAAAGFGGRSAAVRVRAMELLAGAGLAERMSHTPLELSGGEQQRVAMARALINEPELIMADEPTGNLDSGTGERVMECLFALSSGARHSLVIVTHDESLAARCDRSTRIEKGRLLPG